MIGAKLKPLFYGKFTLINKARLRIKVFEPYEDISNNFFMMSAILISYDYVFKRSTNPVLKALGLNLSKKLKTNIKTIRGRMGKTYRFNI